MSNALNSFSPDKKRPHGKGPKIRVLPCSRFAYVKIQTLQCFSQVARRQGQSRWGRCWTSYRAASVEGQPRPAPITANSAAAQHPCGGRIWPLRIQKIPATMKWLSPLSL